MSPKRNDPAPIPTLPDEWKLILGTTDAANGWDELSRIATANTRRCWDALRTNPRSTANRQRQHRLAGPLATGAYKGAALEQWEYEVTSGGRVRYLIDDDARTVWIVYASPQHPKDTE